MKFDGDTFQRELMKVVEKYKTNFTITKMKGKIIIKTYDGVFRKIKLKKNKDVLDILENNDNYLLFTEQSIKIPSSKKFHDYDDITLKICGDKVIIDSDVCNQCGGFYMIYIY